MPLPSEIQMVEGRFGTALSIFGDSVSLRVDVKATHELVWAATGQPVLPFGKTFSVAAGIEGKFSLPAVNQVGWLLQATGAPFTMWAYVVEITYTLQGQTRKRTVNWQPLMGQASVDLDLIAGGFSLPPVVGDIAVVSSLAGLTGEVTIQDLEDLGLGGGPGGSSSWADISGKPAVIAGGATKAAARTAIDAAAITDIPTYANLQGKPAFIAAGTTEAAARAAIGALGATDIPTPPNWSNISGKPAVVAAGATTQAARTAIEAVSAADVDNRFSQLINGAPAAFDTLKEIADYIASDQSATTAINTALGERPTTTVVDSKIATSAATLQPKNARLTDIAALGVPAINDVMLGNGSTWTKKSMEQLKVILGGAISRPNSLVTFDGALANRNTTGVRIVAAGNSIVAGQAASSPGKRWVNWFAAFMQTVYNATNSSEPKVLADTNGNFGTNLPVLPGVQVFNIGENGTEAGTYLTDAESQTIASLDPSMVLHVVGTNDFRRNISVATYESNLRNRLAYLRARLTRKPCVHVLVNLFEAWDTTGTTAWALYGEAMARIAVDFPNDVVYVDTNPQWISFKVPGAKGTPGTTNTDPNNLIISDKIHPSDAGHEQLARWIYQGVMGVAPTNPAKPPDDGETLAKSVVDNFNRTSTTSLGSAASGQSWSVTSGTTWVTDGSVAYMSAGSNGLARAVCGYSDITFAIKMKRPATWTDRIYVRASDSVNSGIAMFFSTNGDINLGIVVNGTVTTKSSLASGVAKGEFAALTLTANGKNVTGTINGTAVPGFTLTDAEMASLPGTSIAIGQTSAGATEGGFDDVQADTVVVVVPPTNLVTDTFTRTASTIGTADSGQAWALEQGALATNGTRVHPTTVPAVASIGTSGLRNGRFTIETVMPGSTGYPAVWGRGLGTSSRISLTCNGSNQNLELAIVIGGTATQKGAVLIPGTIPAAGSIVTMTLEIKDLVVTAYWNGVLVPGLTFTLTASEDSSLSNTRAGFRLNGPNNSPTTLGIETFSVQSIDGSAAADSATFPTGNTADGKWKLDWANDFNTAFAKGQAKAVLGDDLTGYDGGKDTSNWGTYNSIKTMSAVSGAISGTTGQGVLVIEPYYDSAADTYWEGAITPPANSNPGPATWGQSSVRASIRMRIINNVKGDYIKSDGTTGQDTGQKFVDLQWPAVVKGAVDPNGVTIIDPWDYGELNGPEGNTAGVPEGFAHFAGGSAGSRNHGNALAFSYNVPFSEWHTYTKEHVIGQYVRYYLDGILVKVAPASGVPFVKTYRSFRTETWLDKTKRPPIEGTCRVEIDWAATYTYIP